MSTYSGRKRSYSILLVLLTMAILLDRFLIAGLAPGISHLAGVNPMIVFLDIPVQLPVMIDLPVIGLFFLFYFILLLSYPSRYGASTAQGLRKRLWRVAAGSLVILLCLVVGAGIYSLSDGLLSRQFRNGIDSFGIQADIYTGIPDYEIIHLRGGMILLVFFLIGLRIFSKLTTVPGATAEPAVELEAQGLLPGKIGRPGKIHRPEKVDRSGKIDPRITGFQGKRGNPAEREFAEQLAQKRLGEREVITREKETVRLPDTAVLRPRTAATSVPVVAPLRAKI